MIRRLPLFMALGMTWAMAGETNAPTGPVQEVVEVQGVKIWKKGRPTNAYTTIANESLLKVTLPEAQNRIALAVQARKGNAAIITSMVPSQRLDITQNTGINRLDGLNVLYQIILLKP
jgi:hypothetical protein